MFNFEILAFVMYLLFIIAVSVYFFMKERNGSEKSYFIGGREMGPFVTAMSAQASDMSGWLLMGLPGSILAFGLGQAWIGIGLAIGTAANWILVAKRLRCYSQAAGDAITLPQYLSNRFCAQNAGLRITCAVIFLVFFTVYVASSIVAGTTVITTIFSVMSEKTAMIIYAIALVLITFFGGYKAVCWTDFFQALMMLIALLAVPIVALLTLDLDANALSEVYTYTDKLGNVSEYAFGASVFGASWKDILSGLGWGLGYFGMPHILVRFMGIKDPNMVKTSAVTGIVWVVLTLGAACLMAYIGRMVFAEELLTNGAQQTIFIVFARKLFVPFIAGLLMSAIIAASMSTADSQLLVASSAFTSDIFKRSIKKDASDKETLWLGRAVVVVIAIVAYMIASSKGSGAQAIMNMVENAWAGFGSSFGPVVLLSLFWKKVNYTGALAGVIVGAVTDVAWLTLLGFTGIYEIIPGFICGTLACIIASKLAGEPSADVKAVIEEAEKLRLEK